MKLSKLIRYLQQKFEAIPAPGAIIYNALVTKILRKPEQKIAKNIIEKIRSGAILDLGSGTGYLSIEIAKMQPNIQVYGIDLSRKMVKIAQDHSKNIENIHFVLGNASVMDFENDSFDFIVSTGSLHHWKKPVKVFNECYRVLKLGNEAWIYDGCPDTIKENADRIKEEYGLLGYHIAVKIAELHGFTLDEYNVKIKDILDQTKFKNNYQMELTDYMMKIILKK